MNLNYEVTVNASADKVWKIIGADFNKADKWAVRMLKSTGSPDLGPIGGRLIQTVEYGEGKETLVLFDDEQRKLAYRVQAPGLPPVLQDIRIGWRVESKGDNQAVVHNTFEANLSNPEMHDMITQQSQQGTKMLFEELKHYAENGKPHPRKQEQLASKN